MPWRFLFGSSLILAVVGASGYAYWTSSKGANIAGAAASYQTLDETNDVYVRFVMEAYDLIQKNYWQKADDKQLAQLFTLSVQKAAATTTAEAVDRASTAKLVAAQLAPLKDDAAKRQIATQMLQVALYNMAPTGRNQLLTSQQQKAVQQTVQKVNPASDLYSELGVTDAATREEIQAAYEKKKAELAASSSPEAAKELERVSYVGDVLVDPTAKERYDTSKAEPTVFSRRFGSTLYIRLDRMAPTTAADITAVLENASTSPLSSLIFDLRGNLGGALDQVPTMLGIFMGKNQYEFDIYHQGDFTVVRSPIDKIPQLDRYKEIALLTDNMTQSSAEVFAAAMKRFRLGVVVGATTRGWGSIEGTYPLTTKIDPDTDYALMLVYGLTLREDNQPVEGKGVDPDISLADSAWRSKLSTQLRSQSLIDAVKQTVTATQLQ